MPTVYVTDANVWVARYKVNDSHSLVSQRWIDTMLRTRKQFAAPEILYLEVVSRLHAQLMWRWRTEHISN